MTEDLDDLNELDSFSKRLKYIVDSQGLKQSHMADKLGLSPAGLHYILNNDVKFSKNAKKLAQFLNVNENWLLRGEGNVFVENTKVKTYIVPVYYPDQLKVFYNSNQKLKLQATSEAITAIQYSQDVRGIYVTEANFSPKFEVGDIVIFENTSTFKNGEILLVYLHKTNQIVMRYGFNIKESIILLSNNDEPIELGDAQSDVIIGAYRECFKKFHH